MRPFLSSVPALLFAAAACLLAGCATSFTMPDAASVDASAASSFGEIQGSNFGGHAPIVGAHVFLLQASTGGYYAASTSLLQAGESGGPDYYGSTYPTAKDTTTGSPTNGDYYITTDNYGDFDLNGTGYTCTPGLPVYLYAQGGNPETNPNTGFHVVVTGATISGTGPYTIKFTTIGANLVYQGETLNMSGFSGNFGTYFNGTTQTVLPDANLTTTSFDISVTTLTNNGVTLAGGTQTGAAGTATQTTPVSSNPAIVNLAVLGICPSGGTANFSNLPFVYMNEVSTAAAAYALGGFFPAPGTTGLANAGAVAANLSIPASNTLALTGLQNAALTADQLYDISGTNVGAGADGETHIARTTTPGVAVYATTTSGSKIVTVGSSVGLQAGVAITGAGIPANATITAINTGVTPNTITLSANATATGSSVPLRAGAGNGTVPQSLLDTIGNILANCVDSANTYSVYTATGTTSTQCSGLFANTKSAGTSGTSPADTASAAIDIAHNPWANVTTLVQSPTGNTPFVPKLGAANDLSVGIEYIPANIVQPQGIAVDGFGNVWYTNATAGGYVTTLTPVGGVLYNQVYVANEVPTYITIDIYNSAWYGDEADMGLHEVFSSGTYQNTMVVNSMTNPYGIASDGNGNVYVSLNQTEYGQVYDFDNYAYLTNPPVNPLAGVNDPSCLGTTKSLTNPFDADHLAIDNKTQGYNLWIASEVGNVVCEVSSTNGALLQAFQIGAPYPVSTEHGPEFLGIDSYGSVWVPSQFSSTMNKITYHAGGGTLSQLGGVTLTNPFGTAVDGANNVWVTSRGTNDIAEYLGNTSAAVSTVRFGGGGSVSVMSDPLNDAVDPSGNLWITNYTSGRIVELVGIAAPTYTPLSAAAKAGKLGSKP